jgi:hypothetical protein
MGKVEYFFDGSRIVASIDEGSDGFFVHHYGDRGSSPWRYVVPGSIEWDDIHQDLFFAHHDLDSYPPEQAAKLPPIPPVPSYKRIEWKDNFDSKGSLLAASFPALARRIAGSPDSVVRFWFLLEEDRYETEFGDGLFLYFHGRVFDTEAAAREFVDQENKESEDKASTGPLGTRLYLKAFEARIAKALIRPTGYEPERHEHYSIEDLLIRIESILSANRKEDWGKPDSK